jgi:acetyl-CoA carboxylase carboxyl transferase subunit alpha
MDEIVPEPLGGAHADPVSAFPYIKDQLMATYNYYSTMTPEEIMLDRWAAGRGWGAAQPCLCGQHLADASELGT